MNDFIPGTIYRVSYPFMCTTYELTEWDEGGYTTSTLACWQPGVKGAKQHGRNWEEPSCYLVDGEGTQILTLVSRHKPTPKYRERAFYTQSWLDPDGKSFGSSQLRVTTLRRFAGMVQGYRFPFIVEKSNHEIPVSPGTPAPSGRLIQLRG